MRNFEYIRPKSLKDAVASLGAGFNECAVKAGGTDILGEMKNSINTPDKVLNLETINDLKYIKLNSNTLEIGPTVKIAEIAVNEQVRKVLPVLAKAAAKVASPQIRNMGTISGNICQRPRCWYYRDSEVHCMKKGGDMCYAVMGRNKYHAILGGSPCFIVHPSDTAVALMAYNARFTISNNDGDREVAADDFFILPEDNLERENILEPGDILSKITVPVPPEGTRGLFVKVQEREVWDFAVASIAANVTVQGGVCTAARIVLGGAAPKPWRAVEAENVLIGKSLNHTTAKVASETAIKNPDPLEENAYKIDLFKNLINRAILDLA
ncbi:FAD binding domain-containing protein [candidate division KSB1 bacterium]